MEKIKIMNLNRIIKFNVVDNGVSGKMETPFYVLH